MRVSVAETGLRRLTNCHASVQGQRRMDKPLLTAANRLYGIELANTRDTAWIIVTTRNEAVLYESQRPIQSPLFQNRWQNTRAA